MQFVATCANACAGASRRAYRPAIRTPGSRQPVISNHVLLGDPRHAISVRDPVFA